MERDDIEAHYRRNGDTVSKEKLMTATDIRQVKLLNFMHKKRSMDIQTEKATPEQVRKY